MVCASCVPPTDIIRLDSLKLPHWQFPPTVTESGETYEHRIWSVKYYEDIVDDASAVLERLTAETVTNFGTRRSGNCMQSSEGSKEIIPVKNQDDEVSYAIQYRCRPTKQK